MKEVFLRWGYVEIAGTNIFRLLDYSIEVWILHCQTCPSETVIFSELTLIVTVGRTIFTILIKSLTNTGKSSGFSGKTCPWEVPRVIRLSFGAAPLWKV